MSEIEKFQPTQEAIDESTTLLVTIERMEARLEQVAYSFNALRQEFERQGVGCSNMGEIVEVNLPDGSVVCAKLKEVFVVNAAAGRRLRMSLTIEGDPKPAGMVVSVEHREIAIRVLGAGSRAYRENEFSEFDLETIIGKFRSQVLP